MEKEQEVASNEIEKNENIVHMIKFFFFSISAGGIQALTFTFMKEVLNLTDQPSYLAALILSILWNFTLNRKFTFKSAANVPVAMLKVALFYAVFTPLSLWWVGALEDIEWNSYLVLFITMITNLVTEFLYTKYVVYKNQINTAVTEKNE